VCTICCVFCTHSLSRCCLYQATRDVDVAVEAPAVSVVSEGGVLQGTESCAAFVLWVYARCPHATLDNPAWSAVIVLSRPIYPQPAHVVHGVLLHLIPMSWSWTHFKLLPLSSLWSRHTPHPDCIFSSPSAHRLRIGVTRIHPPTSARSPWAPPPAYFMAWTLSPFHTFTLPHSALGSPALDALSPLVYVCLFVCMGGG
jgi:hypothetical protein